MAAICVILPVHNRADVLPRAISSVLEQDLGNFELIVVDDGSTDASAAVAESFSDERIRVLRLERNRGANVARNEAARAADAPLLAFLDSDDLYLPGKLAWVTEEFARRPGLDLLVDSFLKVGPGGSREQVRRNPVITERARFRRALFTRRLWKATPAITVRRQIALEAGLFDETLNRLQDFDFLVRVSSFANCASTDKLLWVKHWHENAISGEDDMIAANIELARRHPEFLSTAAYRPGFAHALRLSAWRRMRRGDILGIARDLHEIAAAFGGLEAARLTFAAMAPRPLVQRQIYEAGEDE